MKQHKWHKEIKAWADGAEIEYRNGYRKMCWTKCEHPTFEVDEEWEYRIKPQLVKPQYLYAYKVNAKIVELYDELQMGWDGKRLLGKIPLIVESNDD